MWCLSVGWLSCLTSVRCHYISLGKHHNQLPRCHLRSSLVKQGLSFLTLSCTENSQPQAQGSELFRHVFKALENFHFVGVGDYSLCSNMVENPDGQTAS